MKKILLLLVISFLTLSIQAQKFAYVDTDYILNKIPDFKQAQDKLDALSADWQKEIEKLSLKLRTNFCRNTEMLS